MAVRNDIDRFGLVRDVIDHLPQLGASAAHVRQLMREKLIEHREHVHRHGEDMDEVRRWQWTR
jgi:xylulose-5-phosphate/fructose-6-phosphate phosphoketolase